MCIHLKAGKCFCIYVFYIVYFNVAHFCSFVKVPLAKLLPVGKTWLQKANQRMKRRDSSRIRSFTCDVPWTDRLLLSTVLVASVRGYQLS